MTILAKKLMGVGNNLSFLLGMLVVLCSAQMAQAEDLRWTGAGNGDINNKDNWDPKKTIKGTTKYNLYFETSKITNWQNIRSTAMINARGGWFLKAGTKDQPLRFTAENSAHGVKPGGSSNYASYINMAGNAESWAVFDGGTYGPFVSYIIVGSDSYAGYLTIDSSRGVETTVSTSAYVELNNGSIEVKGQNSLLKANNYFAIKNNSEASVSDSGKIDLSGNLNVYDAKYSHNEATTIAKCINIAINENDEGNAVFNGGTMTLSALSAIGYGKNSKGAMAATDLMLTIGSNANFVLGGYDSSYEGAIGEVIKTGGDWTIGGDVILGNALGGSGVFTQNSGTVTVANNKWTKSTSGNGVLNLNGGTFATQHLQDEVEGGSLTVNFNGGTLKANAEHANGLFTHGKGTGLFVKVGEKGGTIDTGAFDISIPVAIDNADDQEGSIKLMGGGSVALNGSLNYTGKTTVGLQTAISAVEKEIKFSGSLAFEVSSKLKISRNAPKAVSATSIELPKEGKVVVDFIVSELKPGSYNLLTHTGDGVFLDTDADKFEPGENAPICKFSISEDKKSVVLTLENVPLGVWTGKGDGVTFSDTANWSGNMLPTQADDVKIDVSESAELVCDIPLNVNSIMFAETCALVTIAGDGCITNATTIVNNSEARHVVNVPVEFYAEETYRTIDVTGEVDFRGGVKGTLPANHTTFYGNYTLTATSWNLDTPITLASSASIVASSLTLSLNCTRALNAYPQSALQVSTLDGKAASEMFGEYSGSFVANTIQIANDTNSHRIGSGFTGVMYVNYVLLPKGASNPSFYFNPSSSARIVVGGGSGFESIRGYLRIGVADSTPLVLHSAGNWSFVMTDHKYNSGADNIKIELQNDLIIDTSNYANSTETGFVVTIKNNAWKENKYQQMLSGNKSVSVYGNGILKFEARDAQFTGGLIAYDGVTVAVNNGIYPGKGNVTIKDTATLKLEQSSSGTVPIVGTLTMEGGSTINIPSYSADIVPLSVNGLTFANVTDEKKVVVKIDGGALRYGFNAILKSNEEIPADVWANIDLQLAESVVVPEGMTMVKLVQGKMLYILIKGENEVIWTGSGNDANFSNAANWMGGSIPANGSSLLIATADAATLVNDISGFAPASITFSGISSITIDGENAIEGVTAITNLSAKTHTINVPVKFTGPIAVAQPAVGYSSLSNAHIVFAGGAYAAEGCTIASIDDGYSWAMFGKYFFANGREDDAPYVAKDTSIARPALGDASELHVPKAGEIKELYVGKASLLNIGKSSLVAATDNAPRLSYINGGEVVVEELLVSGTGGKYDGYATFNKSSPESNIVKIEKAVCLRTDGWTFYFAAGSVASKGTYYFGKGGLSFGESNNGFFGIGMNADGDEQTIRPWYSDFTIASGAGNDKSGYDIYMYRSVVFNTNDEEGIGRTITLDARPRFRYSPSFKVSGSGKVLVNSMASNIDQPAITVADSATLAYKPGASLGTGLATVNGGAALEVAMSGKVALKGNLTLKDGAVLGFNFTERAVAPVLDFTDSELIAEGGIKVRISTPAGKFPISKKHILTSGANLEDGVSVEYLGEKPNWVIGVGVEDGEIYARIRSLGTKIIVR